MRSDLVLLVLRFVLAVVLWPHGAQKALGLFNGPGIAHTVGFLGHMGFGPVLAYLVIAVEFLGPIALVLGILTRLAALGIAVDMAMAASTVHWSNGFFMNWGGHQAGEGIEYFIYAVGVAVALMIGGGGRYALTPRL